MSGRFLLFLQVPRFQGRDVKRRQTYEIFHYFRGYARAFCGAKNIPLERDQGRKDFPWGEMLRDQI